MIKGQEPITSTSKNSNIKQSSKSYNYNQNSTQIINFLDDLTKTKTNLKRLLAKVQHSDITSDVFSDWWRSSPLVKFFKTSEHSTLQPMTGNIIKAALRDVGSIVGTVAGILGFESLLPAALRSHNYNNQKLRESNKEILIAQLQDQLEDVMNEITSKRDSMIQSNHEYLNTKLSQIEDNNQSFTFNADSERAREQFSKRASKLTEDYNRVKETQDHLLFNSDNRNTLNSEQISKLNTESTNLTNEFINNPLKIQTSNRKEPQNG